MPKLVRALYGPRRGRLLQLSDTDAERAINDGWAVNPYSPTRPQDVDRAKAIGAAERAERKRLRHAVARPATKADPKDETYETAKGEPDDPKKADRAMEAKTPAEDAGTYQTRVVRRGRPPKKKG